MTKEYNSAANQKIVISGFGDSQKGSAGVRSVKLIIVCLGKSFIFNTMCLYQEMTKQISTFMEVNGMLQTRKSLNYCCLNNK